MKREAKRRCEATRKRCAPLLALWVFMFIASIAFAGCSGGPKRPMASPPPETRGSAEAGQAPPSTPAPTIGGSLLKLAQEPLTGFSYAAFPSGAADLPVPDGVLWETEISLHKNAGEQYQKEIDGLVDALADGLDAFALAEGGGQEIESADQLPHGGYMCFWLSLDDGAPLIYIYENGSVLLWPNQPDQAQRLYQAADGTQYEKLKDTVDQIRAQMKGFPLDYYIKLFVMYPSVFTPDSTGLAVAVENGSEKPVTFDTRFQVERLEKGSWNELQYAASSPAGKTVTLEPNSRNFYSLYLTDLEGGQEQGDYRLSQTFVCNGETARLSAQYTISDDAPDQSYPLPPEMTPENQEYCEKYVSMWGFYSPFAEDFTEDSYLTNLHTYLTYSPIIFAQGKRDEYQAKYGADIPAEIVEEAICSHFLLTPDQVRAMTPTQSQNSDEYYDPDKNIYHFAGGYGGGANSAVVADSKREGNLLTLVCDWYTVESAYLESNRLTIRLDDDGGFQYLASEKIDGPNLNR